MARVMPSGAVLPARRTNASAEAAAETVLSSRALNRALLERQLLLRRETVRVSEALEHLVGLQAQNPNGPYIGLWSRLEGFHPDDLAGMIDRRLVVRIALMRWPLHVVTS